MTDDATTPQPATDGPVFAAPVQAGPSVPSPRQTDYQRLWIGRLLIVAAAILWSSAGFFVKAPFFEGWSGPTLAFWRALMASAVLVPAVRRPRFSWSLVPMTLIFAAMNCTYLTALTLTESACAIWLQNTAPIWVLIVGVVVMRESSRLADWAMMACGMCGLATILYGEMRGEAWQGVAIGVVSGQLYAGVVLFLRHLRSHDAFWLIAINHVVTMLVLIPVIALHPVWPSPLQLILLACFGILQMGLPYVLFAQGVKYLSGHEASFIGLLEPILVPVWVFLAWSHLPSYQTPKMTTIAGAGLILVGLLARFTRVEPSAQ